MKRVIAGGTGFIGKHLAQHWLRQSELIVIGRDKKKIVDTFAASVQAVTWDEVKNNPEIILDNIECIVNLTGANIASSRWTKARKQELLDSRIIPTQFLADICVVKGADAPALLNAGGIGIYGLQKSTGQGLPSPMDENTIIDFNAKPDFLATVGRAWESATLPAKNAGTRVVNMRFAPVLAKDGGVLPKIAMPFYFYLGGQIGDGRQPFCWVSLIDLLKAIDFLLAQSTITGPVNVVAPNAVTQQEFAQTLAKVLNKPAFMTMPAFMLELLFGEMANELLLSGQHVIPRRLQESGFVFEHPELQETLGNIYQG